MKHVIRGGLLILLLVIGYEIHSTNAHLKHIIHNQNKQIKNLYREKSINDSLCNNLLNNFPIGSPLKFILINSKFGFRKDPFSRRYKKHMGLDLKGTPKDTVFTTGGGYVEIASYYGGYGKCVVINHGKGYKTLYGHLSKIFIKEGEFVLDKQPIGKVGNTGHSKGSHLHYEIHKDGVPVNPKEMIFINF